MSATVRILPATYEKLSILAEDMHLSLTDTLEQAVETLRRERILDQTNQAYAALQADPKAWRDELDERRVWERTLGDGQSEE